MSTCKDFLHYDVCQVLEEYNNIPKVHPKQCGCFKPKADYVEVKYGEWGKEKWMDTNQHICSLCHSTVRVHPQSVEYKYCPYCGAKMKRNESEVR